MARVLFVASGLVGGLHTTLEFARRLREDGHIVQFAAPAKGRDLIDSLGFPVSEIPEPDLNVAAARLPPLADWRSRTWARRSKRLDQGVATLGVADFPEILRAQAPDVVLVDLELHAHIMIAVSAGFRTVLYSPMFLGTPGRASPPLNSRTILGAGWRGSAAGILVSWARFFIWKQRTLMRRALKDWGGDYASILRRHARRTGFDRARHVQRWRWQFPWSYRLPLLILHARELDLPAKPDPNVRYVGPMILRDKSEQRGRVHPVPAVRSSTLAERRFIYAAFGSLVEPSSAIVSALWQAVARNPDWHMLFVRPMRGRSDLPDSRPGNIDVVPWAAQIDQLKLADVAVIHGGASSVVECVDAAVPMLVCPCAMDQFGNAARVAYHGLGRVVGRDDDADKIEADLRALMADPVPRVALQELRSASRAYERDGIAEKAVSELLIRPAVWAP